MLDEINFSLSVCFSGHRPDRLPGDGDRNMPETQKLITALRKHIEDAIRRGKVFYLHGAMAGFDILAVEQVIALKKVYPQIRLITIAPFSVHFYGHEKCWTAEWKGRATEIFRQDDFGISLAEHYRSGIYYECDRALVDRSSELICYHDGGKSGTKYTVDFARGKNLSIHNLYERAAKNI